MKRVLIVTAVVSAVATLAVIALLVNIFERKQEARDPFYRVVAITDQTEDAAVWGKDFPMEYDAYLRTVEQVPTKYAGSEAVPHLATPADPRTFVGRSKLDQDPRRKILWAGYAFAADYRERRGHAYMLDDQMYTGRQQASKQPGTCVHCHASVYLPYKKLGGGDLFKGFESMNHMPYADARELVSHPLSCIDCHEPSTMALRVTRPAFLEGIRALKASQGIANFDPNRDATRQEMRSYVCGQCHVEYYFKGPEKRLVYPWAKGISIDRILDYYEEVQQVDWVHADTGTGVLKAQHPEFEMWNQGIHARSGVACADCHMPYMRSGALKISDHHVQSPLLDINRACQTCHHWPEAELKARVETIQDRVSVLRDRTMTAVVALITDIKAARAAGRPDAELAEARRLQRRAQFMLDFVEAENSTGFHAPEEAERILAESIDCARQGQLVLRGISHPVVNSSAVPVSTR